MRSTALQSSLPFLACPIAEAVADLSVATGDERGAIYTRVEVVEFILDLMGYTTEHPLSDYRLLEPSFGHGDFLLPAVERLLSAYRGSDVVADLYGSIRAVEIHRDSFAATAEKLRSLITRFGHSRQQAESLIDCWLVSGDFLLVDLPANFTHVVGNPPYLRQESIAAPLLAEYRRRYSTIFDRADLYIPFFERGLNLLEPRGSLGFICSDRWMKNRYGGPLRELIASKHHLAIYVDMVGVSAFHSDVVAYPAVTVIKHEPTGVTRIGRCVSADPAALSELALTLHGDGGDTGQVCARADVVQGAEPWMLSVSSQLALVRRLEATFPLLEDAGCRVGIGVATGADHVFIGAMDALDVEPDRKLALITTRDIKGGKVMWQGLGVINPFADDGGLVDLAHYPRLEKYLERHGETVRGRNVARKNPKAWFRTIDRIVPALASSPKLLIPDIKGNAHIVYEDGRYYPHHNLYYIVSETWDLKVLQAVLMSGIANLFVSAYSVKMRGGHLRYQAQYLRRIRLPMWHDVSPSLREALLAAIEKDKAASDEAVFDIYGLDASERDLLRKG